MRTSGFICGREQKNQQWNAFSSWQQKPRPKMSPMSSDPTSSDPAQASRRLWVSECTHAIQEKREMAFPIKNKKLSTVDIGVFRETPDLGSNDGGRTMSEYYYLTWTWARKKKAISQPLASHWPNNGQALANHSPTIGQPLSYCFLNMILFVLVTQVDVCAT